MTLSAICKEAMAAPSPLSQDAIDTAVEEGKYVAVSVEIELYEIIGYPFSDFIDLLAERAGCEVLMDVSYNLVGFKGETLIFNVHGDPQLASTDYGVDQS